MTRILIDYEFLKKFKKPGYLIRSLLQIKKYKNNRKLVLIAINQNPYNLRYASDFLKNDEEIMVLITILIF